jgi:hypothetical protein
MLSTRTRTPTMAYLQCLLAHPDHLGLAVLGLVVGTAHPRLQLLSLLRRAHTS